MIKLKKLLEDHSIDALLVSNPYNILYLTGFLGLSPTEREAWVFATKKKIYLITDHRYEDFNPSHKDASERKKIEVVFISHSQPLKQVIESLCRKSGASQLFFEKENLTYFEYEYFKKHTPIPLRGSEKLIATLRDIKTTEELSAIQKACTVTDTCFSEIVASIKIGQTEKDIAFGIEYWLKKNNYDMAFYPIVAIDENAAIAHYDTRLKGTKKAQKGSTILIDFGALVNNYMSDMTRMVCIGKPSDEFQNAYQVVLDAYDSAMRKLSLGTAYQEVDSAARVPIEKAGYPTFQHATGHGLGLQIHEGPKISLNSQEKAQPGHVITIEPGIYLPGKFGIRFENTVAIEKSGTVREMTQSQRAISLRLGT